MTEEQFKHFSKSMRTLSLSDQEKGAIKEKLLVEMRLPVRVPSPVFWENFLYARAFVALALVFVIGSGVAFAAEGALPGDFLYPVKIGVNEKVAGVFSSTAGKAEREALFIERRLDEARELVLKNRLSSENALLIDERLAFHTDNVKKYIGALEENKDFGEILKLENRLESSFGENERILNSLQGRDNDLSSIALRTKDGLSEFSTRRSDAENSLIEMSDINIARISEDSLESALQALDGIEKLAEDIQGISSMKRYIEEYIEAIEEKINEGKILREVKLYNEAISLFGEATRLAGEAKSLIEANEHFEVELQIAPEILKRLETEKVESSGEVKGEFKDNSRSRERRPKAEI